MKSSVKLLSASISSVIALSLLAGTATTAQALTWNDASNNGTWDVGSSNWLPGPTGWSQTGAAVFTGAGGTITIGSDLDIGSINFNGATGSYIFNNTSPTYTIDFTGTGISNTSIHDQTFNSNGVINFNGSSASAGSSKIIISGTGNLNFLDATNAGSAKLLNGGNLTFSGTSHAQTSAITNDGTLSFDGGSFGDSASLINNGTTYIDANTASTVTLGALTNAGSLTVGDKTLQLSGNLTLSDVSLSEINFTLDTPATSGKIVLNGGLSISSLGSGLVDISLVSSGPVTPGTYTLIDWTGSTNVGGSVDINDFNLITPLPGGLLYPASHLVVNGSQLQLVAVPEPATLMMPMAAVLGMAWLRRRTARMAV